MSISRQNDESVLKLGDGYDRFSKKFKKTKAVMAGESKKSLAVQHYGYQVECIQISTSQTANIDISMSLGFRLPTVVPVNSEFASTLNISNHVEEYFMHYLISAYVIESSERLVAENKSEVPALTKESKVYIDHQNKPRDLQQFYHYHGDSYISEVNYGRRLQAVVTVKRKKTEIKKKLDNKVGLDIQESDSAKTGLQLELDRLKDEEIINISGKGIGYQSETISTCSLDVLQKAVNDFFNTEKSIEKTPISYGSKSYEMSLSKEYPKLPIAETFGKYLTAAESLMQELNRLYLETSYYRNILEELTKREVNEDYKLNVQHYQQQLKAFNYFEYINSVLKHYIDDYSAYIFSTDDVTFNAVAQAKKDIELWLSAVRKSNSFKGLLEKKLLQRVSKFNEPYQIIKFNPQHFAKDISKRMLLFSATPKPSSIIKKWEEKPNLQKLLNLPIINKSMEEKLVQPTDAPDFSCSWLAWRRDLSVELRKKRLFRDKQKFSTDDQNSLEHIVPPLLQESQRVLAYLYYTLPESFNFSAEYYLKSSTLAEFNIDIFSVNPTNLTQCMIESVKRTNNLVIEQGAAASSDDVSAAFGACSIEGAVEVSAEEEAASDANMLMMSIQQEEDLAIESNASLQESEKYSSSHFFAKAQNSSHQDAPASLTKIATLAV